MICIYGLVDPKTRKIRYIGQTSNLKYRLWRHMRDAKAGSHLYVHKWIRKVLESDNEPQTQNHCRRLRCHGMPGAAHICRGTGFDVE